MVLCSLQHCVVGVQFRYCFWFFLFLFYSNERPRLLFVSLFFLFFWFFSFVLIRNCRAGTRESVTMFFLCALRPSLRSSLSRWRPSSTRRQSLALRANSAVCGECHYLLLSLCVIFIHCRAILVLSQFYSCFLDGCGVSPRLSFGRIRKNEHTHTHTHKLLCTAMTLCATRAQT